jgi:Zn-dependent protease
VGAYGWAKPVPVNPAHLRNSRNSIIVVSLVGPLTNAVLAALMGVCFVAVGGRTALLSLAAPSLLQQIFFYAGIANIVLAVFNLIPCPPLDGAAVLERLLPARYLPEYYNLQPFLMFLPFLLILIFHNQWSSLINDIINWWINRLV